MKKLTLVVLIEMLFSSSQGQSSRDIFAQTKGGWEFPITNVVEIDTMITDCLGFPGNSPYLVLKADCPAEVRAIQSGRTIAVGEFDGVYTIIIQTSDYFLVYRGLSRPLYKKGDTIQQGSVIGHLTKLEGETTYDLLLMLSKGSKTLNINRWFNWKAAHTGWL